MKLKGLVWFFAIALILISIWELSYTFVVRSYEAKVKTQAERIVKSQYPEVTGEDKNALVKTRMRRILDSTKEKSIYPIVGTSYQKCKENELNLGLDLQGGMSVTMEVSLEGLLKSVSNNSKDAGLVKALQTATAQNIAIVNGKAVPKARLDALAQQVAKSGRPVTPEVQQQFRLHCFVSYCFHPTKPR